MNFVIETDRFFLRELTEEDATMFFELNNNSNVLKYTGDKPFSDIEEARNFLQNYKEYEKYGFGRWAIVDKATNESLGWCGLKYHPETKEVDLGFRIFEKYWNLGVATETAKACLDFGFSTLELQEIIGRAMKENLASIRVLEKCGMRFAKNILIDDKDAVQLSISKT